MSQLISYRRLKTIYTKSPLWLQRAFSSVPYQWRAGSAYRETRRLIEQTDRLDWEQLKCLQLERLFQLLQHTQQHVPHYRDTLRQNRLEPVQSLDDAEKVFRRLPLIEKSAFQKTPSAFRADGGLHEATYLDNTGGSSGTPFEFLKNNRMYPIEQAYMMSQWARVGYEPGDPKLVLRGRAFSERAVGQRWTYNPIYNELVLSAYHLDAATIAATQSVVRRFRPRFIHGYPSAIVTYLKGLKEAGCEPPKGIRAVLCGSEPTYDFQRQFFTNTLGCKVYSWYGQSECVLLAGECEHSEEYHSFPLYGILELIDHEGNSITEPGIEGEIVGTSLNNWAMPFLRYRTGDRGIFAPQGRCQCGRDYRRLKRVTGRQQYFVYTDKHKAVPVTAFVFGQHFSAFRRVCGMQLEQNEPGRLTVRIVRGDDFSESDERELRSKMESSVDNEMRVQFEYVERIAMNRAGKTEFMIQNVKGS